MRLQSKLVILSTILFIQSESFPVSADELSVSANAVVMQEFSSSENTTMTDETLLQESENILDEELLAPSDETPLQEPEPVTTEESNASAPAPTEAPVFHAAVEYYSHGYYVVKGTFTEFLPDISLVHPLYSLDGESWQPCGQNWDLHWMNEEGDEAQTRLHNQICLYNSNEPLKSYLDGKLDYFYLKLHITRENGESYETQAALIERGGPQSISKEISLIASFTPAMRVREMNPFKVYGKYQITVNADATPEDISAFLPDTLPIVVGLYHGIDFITEGTIDCPITWKPLSFSQLTAGESITVPDAAEEIVIPGDTLLSTPMGVFRLDDPLSLNHDMTTDEIRLVLNVVSKNENPTGILTAENNGLEFAFHLKPTGATAIRAYTFLTGDTEWKELPPLPLLDTVNTQPSTANSGYALVLHRDWEPYQSYLSAEAAGEDPSPFLIGLVIEGGVYDDRQLILSWPGTYDLPLNLPVLGGSGGNEGNAGTDNKNDSTEEGQRPGLPQQPEEKAEESSAAPAREPEDNADGSPSAPTRKPEDNADSSSAAPVRKPEGDADSSSAALTRKPEGDADEQQRIQSQASDNTWTEQALNPSSDSDARTYIPARTDTADLPGKEEYPTTHASADTKTDERGPFLPIAAASATAICIAAAIQKAVMRRSSETP